MKIICTQEERNNLMEVITAGCCWIGSGEGKILKTGKKNHKVDIEKFKTATNFIYKNNDQVIDWEIINED